MPKQDNRIKAFVKPQGGYSSSSSSTSSSSTTGWRSSDLFFVFCSVLFKCNCIPISFRSSIVVFMDYYTTKVEGCLRVEIGGCRRGGGVLRHSQKRRREQKSLS